MDFEYSEEQEMIARTAREIAEEYGPEYWRKMDQSHEYPQECEKTLTETGFTGLLIPEEYGGAGLGMAEMVVAIEELGAGGFGMASIGLLVLTATMAANEIKMYGSDEQKEKYLSGIADGNRIFCWGITEPDAGVNTLNLKTRAEMDGNEYIINGEKIFISRADIATNMVLVARTTPIDQIKKKTEGLSLFIIELPDPAIDTNPIEKHGLNYSNACEVFIDDMHIPAGNLLGEEDKGFRHLLDGLNSERLSVGAGAIGTGRIAIEKAVDYACEREVFDAPIGSHQGIQFPLAAAKAHLECAKLMIQKAAYLYDEGKPCWGEVNMGELTAVEAGEEAVYNAMQTFGGYGYAVEYDVERWWREINLWRLAPIPRQLGLSFIGENVLGLPRSY